MLREKRLHELGRPATDWRRQGLHDRCSCRSNARAIPLISIGGAASWSKMCPYGLKGTVHEEIIRRSQ